jgi:hypothetical protein
MTAEEFKTYTDIVSNIATVAAIIFAFVQLRAWRRELVGKTKFQVAHKIAMLAYQVRNEIRHARQPIFFQGEFVGRNKGADEKPEEAVIFDSYFAMARRLEPIRDVLTKLETARFEAEPLIISKDLAPIDLILDLYKKLYVSIQIHHDKDLMAVRHNNINREIFDNEKERRVMFAFEDSDAFGENVDSLVTQLTTRLKVYLR